MEAIKFKESAREKLREFQDESNLERVPLYEFGSEYGETIYLEIDNKVIGIASIVKNGIHPKYNHLYLAVDRANKPLVHELYSKLIDTQSTSSVPLQILIGEDDVSTLKEFMSSHDFVLTLKCECPQIDVEKSLTSLQVQGELPGYRIFKYSELNESQSGLLRDFRINGYIETHFWSPPVSIDSDVWEETDPNIEEQEISWAVFKGEQVVLCSDAHLIDDYVWLGWGWHNQKLINSQLLQKLWVEVLHRQLSFCQESNKNLFGEFDSTDKYGQQKIKLLVHQTKDTSYIYQQSA